MVYGVADHAAYQHQQPTVDCDNAGNISIPGNATSNYTFSMDSDDGSVLFIDGVSLINHTGRLPRTRARA
jgi:hypothetical protein